MNASFRALMLAGFCLQLHLLTTSFTYHNYGGAGIVSYHLTFMSVSLFISTRRISIFPFAIHDIKNHYIPRELTIINTANVLT